MASESVAEWVSGMAAWGTIPYLLTSRANSGHQPPSLIGSRRVSTTSRSLSGRSASSTARCRKAAAFSSLSWK